MRELLREQQGLGFELRIEYGQAIVARAGLPAPRRGSRPAGGGRREAGDGGARDLRAALRRPAARLRLDPPEWLAAVREQPRKQATWWPVGALVNKVVAIADERGMAVEDPLTFHAAFPGLNVPGTGRSGVLRGTLPGTSLSGRLVSLAERRMWLPDGLREHLADPGGQVGADAAVLAVDPATASTVQEGELEGDVRVAVADGVLTAWRKRSRWQADGESLDQLAADVAAIVRRRAIPLATPAGPARTS